MSNSRRDFLKGSCALLGAGALVPAAASLARASGGEDKPAPTGPRYALIIDVHKCLAAGDCTACTQACHGAHNVPSIPEKNHEVKWIWKESFRHTFPTQVHEYSAQTLVDRPALVLCNHCTNAPCVKVCPTQATFKRPDGLVAMDMHRCIGCRYCMAACPYGSRSFNWSDPRKYMANPRQDYPTRMKGVVEKCTFCPERLAVGKLPHCVEACQAAGHNAMMFGDIHDPASGLAEVLRTRQNLRRKPFLGTEPYVFYLV
ncbi:MAG: sulfate reduction electron transfer complex DsrMKJOP subunit DsrO [Pseudomonadota bacterium]